MARVSSSELFQLHVIRELGARNPGTYLVQRQSPAGDGHDALVLETYANLPPKTVREIDASARRIEAVSHPHVVGVLGVERISGGVCVLSELVDGVPVPEVFFRLSVGARLRVVVDVLGALSALHGAPGGPPIVHAGVLASSAFIARDGVTKLGFAYRAPLCLGAAFAPEVLLADEADLGPHTDVYSAGVMLWEAIMGRPLFGDAAPEQIIAAQLANRVSRLEVGETEAWAAALAPVVDRALATEPGRRFPHVSAMAGELRLAARVRVGSHEAVAKQAFGFESGVQPVHAPSVATAQSEARLRTADTFTAAAEPARVDDHRQIASLAELVASSAPPPPPVRALERPERNADRVVLTPQATVTSIGPAEPSAKPVFSDLGGEHRRWPLLLAASAGAALLALAVAAGAMLFLRREPASRAIAHDAAIPPVAVTAPAPPPTSAAPAAQPPATKLRAVPATNASASATPPPRPKHRRGDMPYNPSSI